MNRGQETHPIRLNTRYQLIQQMVLKKKNFPETPFSGKYLANRGPKLRVGTQKYIGVKRLIPLRYRYQMNCAGSFLFCFVLFFIIIFINPIFGQIFG